MKDEIKKKWENINFEEENNALNQSSYTINFEEENNALNQSLYSDTLSTKSNTPLEPIKKIVKFDIEKINETEKKEKLINQLEKFNINNYKIENRIKVNHYKHYSNNQSRKTKPHESKEILESKNTSIKAHESKEILESKNTSNEIKKPSFDIEGSMHDFSWKKDIDNFEKEIKNYWDEGLWIRIKRWIIDKLVNIIGENNLRESFIQFLTNDYSQLHEIQRLSDDQIVIKVVDKITNNESFDKISVINAYLAGNWEIICYWFIFTVLLFIYRALSSGHRIWLPYTDHPKNWSMIEKNIKKNSLTQLIYNRIKLNSGLKLMPKILSWGRMPIFDIDFIKKERWFRWYLEQMQQRRWKKFWK